MTDTIEERLYSLQAGQYCGLFMPEHVMKKLMKLANEYEREVRRVLSDNKSSLYPYYWIMATSDDKDAIYIHYVCEDDYETVDDRIKLFKPTQPKYHDIVYVTKTHKEAKAIAESLLDD